MNDQDESFETEDFDECESVYDSESDHTDDDQFNTMTIQVPFKPSILHLEHTPFNCPIAVGGDEARHGWPVAKMSERGTARIQLRHACDVTQWTFLMKIAHNLFKYGPISFIFVPKFFK